MIRITVAYDKYNRSFKLVDRELGAILDDGAQYDLCLPFILQGPDKKEENPIVAVDMPIPLG